jgi:hypothetical protein
MREIVAALLFCLSSCSVYDDALIRSGTNASPDATGTTTSPSDAAFRSTTTRGSAGTDPRDAGMPSAADGGKSCLVNPPADYCAGLPALTQPPSIDGMVECGLQLSPMQPLGWNGPNPSPDKHASYAAAWTRDGVYAYVEVHGGALAPHPAAQPVFCGDAVELYVDADAESDDAGSYDAMGTMQFVVAAPTGSAAPDAWRFVQGNPQGAWISKALGVTALPDGYSVETFITASDLGLWQWNPSQRLGFSIVIDVAGDAGVDGAGVGAATRSGCTTQTGQFFLRLGEPHATCPGEPWCDARAFCDPMLLQP